MKKIITFVVIFVCVIINHTAMAEENLLISNFLVAQTNWEASDGFRSTLLPDGKVLWLYGDTILENGQMVRNSMSIWDKNRGYIKFSSGTDNRGFIVRADSPNPNAKWYWTGVPLPATVTNWVHIPVNKVETGGGGGGTFDFKVTGQEIVSYRYDRATTTLTRKAVTPLPLVADVAGNVKVNWTAASTNMTNGYTYLYGVGRLLPDDEYGNSVVVARMPTAKVDAGPTAMRGAWQVLTTTGWKLGALFNVETLRTIGHKFSNVFYVTQRDGKVYAVSKTNEFMGNTIDLYEAPHDYGQFRKIDTLATLTQDADIFYYHVNTHPYLPAPSAGQAWATVARNPIEETVFEAPEKYRPVFVSIPAPSNFPAIANRKR